MNTTFLTLNSKILDLMYGEEGQDLVEYALMLTMISLALVAGINGIATYLVNVFVNVSTSI